MPEDNLVKYKVHAHFDGEPTPEFTEVFNKMVEAGAKFADNHFKNEKTVNEANRICSCSQPFPYATISHICQNCNGFIRGSSK